VSLAQEAVRRDDPVSEAPNHPSARPWRKKGDVAQLSRNCASGAANHTPEGARYQLYHLFISGW